MWWIWIFLFAFLGRNGWGGFGGNGGYGEGCNTCNALPWALNGDAGRELLMNAIQGNGNAIGQLATTLNCDIKSLENSLCNLQSLIQGVGNQVGLTGQQIINNSQNIGCQLGAQLAQCCCDIKTAVERQGYEGRIATIQQTDDIKADSATKFNIISAKIDAQTQLLTEKFNELEKRELQNRNQDLRDRVQTLEFAASQQAQSANLINQLRPCPIPAYPSCSPYQAYNWGAFFNNGCGCGNNNGCGCGCGC